MSDPLWWVVTFCVLAGSVVAALGWLSVRALIARRRKSA